MLFTLVMLYHCSQGHFSDPTGSETPVQLDCGQLTDLAIQEYSNTGCRLFRVVGLLHRVIVWRFVLLHCAKTELELKALYTNTG